MGTRSLHGFEQKNGKIYYQYMQFDGGPTNKGQEHYEAIANAISECPGHFIDKECKPGIQFFKRVKAYLDEISYATGHSIGNHGTVTKEKWLEIDMWQDWQYHWDRAGNFHFFACSNPWTCMIPWELTKKVMESTMKPFSEHHNNPFGDFWNRVEDYNKSYYGDAEKLPAPTLTVEYGEVMAFPEQNDGGFRRYTVIKNRDTNIWASMFADRVTPNSLNLMKDMGVIEVSVKEEA